MGGGGGRRGHLFPFFHFQLLIKSISDFKIYWRIYPHPCQSLESHRAQERQTLSVIAASFTACPSASARRKSNPKFYWIWLGKTKTSKTLLPARLSDFFSHSAFKCPPKRELVDTLCSYDLSLPEKGFFKMLQTESSTFLY